MAFRNILAVMACMCLAGAFGCHHSSLPAASTPPVITGFTPQTGSYGTTVNVVGTGFDGVTNVTVGGAQATFQHINYYQLTLQIPYNAATGTIALVNAEGSGGSPTNFYVTPSIASIAPASGGPGTSVTITGYGLYGTQSVVFGPGGAPANFFVNNANQIMATVPLVSATGPITFTLPASTGTQTAVSSTFTFSLNGATAPQFATPGFSPAWGPAGTAVTLTGTGFQFASAVTIGGVSCYATPASDTTINVVVPPGGVSGPITVTSGLGSSTTATPFYVIPTVTSFTPAQGPAGTLVTLTGSGFMGATGISFGGTPASGFLVLDANTAQANVAPNSATGPIVVTPAGPASPALPTGQSATPFTFVADATGLPVISTLTPLAAYTGATVTLTGSGFLSLTDVFVGNVPDAPAAFTVTDDGDLTLTVPANAQSGFISAANTLGTTSCATVFTVLPTLTGFSPQSGPVGTTVTITGTGFVGATSVTFGGGIAAPFVVVDANTITAQVPANATDGVITVVSSNNTCTSATNYSLGD